MIVKQLISNCSQKELITSIDKCKNAAVEKIAYKGTKIFSETRDLHHGYHGNQEKNSYSLVIAFTNPNNNINTIGCDDWNLTMVTLDNTIRPLLTYYFQLILEYFYHKIGKQKSNSQIEKIS